MASLRNSKHSFSIVISICISLFFGYAAYRLVEVYTDFEVEMKRLDIAYDQIEQVKQQRQRVEQYNRAAATLGQFTNQVQQFGLAPENWHSFDVSVNKSLSFEDAGNILDQLAHSKTYYFQPAALYLGTGAYRIKPRDVAPVPSTNPDVILPPGVALAGAPGVETEVTSVEPQSGGAAAVSQPAVISQPAVMLEGDQQGGDLALEVQGKFIVRGGS